MSLIVVSAVVKMSGRDGGPYVCRTPQARHPREGEGLLRWIELDGGVVKYTRARSEEEGRCREEGRAERAKKKSTLLSLLLCLFSHILLALSLSLSHSLIHTLTHTLIHSPPCLSPISSYIHMPSPLNPLISLYIYCVLDTMVNPRFHHYSL